MTRERKREIEKEKRKKDRQKGNEGTKWHGPIFIKVEN
jgi:hypothetical protein